MAPTTLVTGTTTNQIRSHDTSKVTLNAWNDKHYASVVDLRAELTATYKRWEKKVLGITLTLTKANVTKRYEWLDASRCDFCDNGTPVDVRPAAQDDTMEERYQSAYERAMAPINAIAAMAAGRAVDLNAVMALKLAKGLLPLTYMNAVVKTQAGMMRARFGEDEMTFMGDRYVLALKTMLNRDARIASGKLADYRTWVNDRTFDTVYLLPNATRLYINGDVPQYIAETLRGDLAGKGEDSDIAVITALTRYAFTHPVLSVGSSGSLDLATGLLTVPSNVDYELYLNEVSSAYMIEQIQSGFFQFYLPEPFEATESVMNGAKLPEGSILQGLVPGGDVQGWKLYWLEDTPETVQDPEKPLIFLLVNEATDEIDAYRTTLNLLNSGELPIDVSLYLFRDSRSDRAEVERYNILFFDTPEGKESVVKLVTDVLEGRVLETPKPMRIVLRKFITAGTELPVYCLSGSYILMLNGSDGGSSLFDGAYRNTFDGNIFESDYVRIEGLAGGNVDITLKQGQPVWPEWTGEDTSANIGGDGFVRVDGEWYTEAGAPVDPVSAPIPDDARAA